MHGTRWFALVLMWGPGLVIGGRDCALGANVAGDECTLTVSAGAGGTVTTPGIGTFQYRYGATVTLEAVARPNFAFANWSGSLFSRDRRESFVITADARMRANFVSLLAVLYVDSDAPNDPQPDDITGSDPDEDGTAEHPFDSIQEAIAVAAEGASLIVDRGTYRENLDLLGKSLRLFGVDPHDPDGGPCAVIEGTGDGPVIRFSDNGLGCALTGFVLTAGQGQPGGAILCHSSDPTIANCLIVGNRAGGPDAAAIYCTDSQATFINCTIADNYAGPAGAGLTLLNSDVVLRNSILWGNGPAEILVRGTSYPRLRYCDVRGGWSGPGDFDRDPLFARHGNWVSAGAAGVVLGPEHAEAVWATGDYHLQARAGRWDPWAQGWVQDAASSPCIDAGAPAGAGLDEPVDFADAHLKMAVENALYLPDPTATDMLGLVELVCPSYGSYDQIASLTGLEYAVNLRALNLSNHRIRSVSALSGLTGLRVVTVLGNQISNIAPLAGLHQLETLDLEQNRVYTIAALSGLSRLKEVGLHRNYVADISPLTNLHALTWLDLRINPLNPDAYTVYLPRIQANNPGATLLCDAPFAEGPGWSSGPSIEEATRTAGTEAAALLHARAPAGDWSPEPQPNGGRVNLGAYGGTTQASKSP
jgi:hypothetical protein